MYGAKKAVSLWGSDKHKSFVASKQTAFSKKMFRETFFLDILVDVIN